MKSTSVIWSASALVCGVSALALSTSLAQADTSSAKEYLAEIEEAGTYLSGDKHNHTTCTDGAMSVQTVVNESLVTYGLDWFSQTGHGGEGPRDCRFDDPEYDGAVSGSGDFWERTIGTEKIAGDEELTGGFGAGTFFEDGDGQEMWRWQSLIEYAYPLQRTMGEIADEPVWLGLEHNAPGHEHVSMAITAGQFGPRGNAIELGQFEYLFDRSDDDTSNGADLGLDFEGEAGFAKNEDRSGTEGHLAAVRSVEFLVNTYGTDAYYVPAHVERQGGFVSDSTRGFNVENFRNFHTAGLVNPRLPEGESIVFGAEMLAGHQFANGGRGTYEADRPTAGFGTYGGAGAYSGAEVSQAGFDFEGNEITNATLTEVREELNALFEDRLTEPSGADQYDQLDACSDCSDPAPADIGTSPRERFVLGRPGIQTMWDALLGEGRRFFNFGSSDWHNRGAFGPFEPQSTLDPWPGEYNKLYAYAKGDVDGFGRKSARKIIDGMRSGNSWSVMGDLIDEFYFVMCQANRCATMGEELRVNPRRGDITWVMKLRDPEGANFSPYTFDNPSLLQIGMNVPMNEPKLSHVDVIRGDITGMIDPDDPAYVSNVSNPTTEIFATIDNLGGEFAEEDGYLVASGVIPIEDVDRDMYFRVRGTNMPVGTPNETDENGNPLLDDFSSLIPCTATSELIAEVEIATTGSPFFTARGASGTNLESGPSTGAQFDPAACPEHLPVDADGVKYLDADVEAWADLWFYANPIFIDVQERRVRTFRHR